MKSLVVGRPIFLALECGKKITLKEGLLVCMQVSCSCIHAKLFVDEVLHGKMS